MGPGKAELLARIARSGSIAAACREMAMSYRRAWSMMRTVNASFRAPLIVAAKGGRSGGGAVLTPLGKQVLKRYQAMLAKAERVTAADFKALRLALKR